MGGSVPDLSDVGIKAQQRLADNFRSEIAELIDRESLSFPGAQPVSFARKHLKELRTRDYYVCEKSDGIRCLLYFTHDGDQEIHYLIDRKNDYYYVSGLHFPLAPSDPKGEVDWASFHTGTLLDGELLWDIYPDGSKILKYLVFDCLVLDHGPLMNRTLDKRLAYFMEKIHKPYAALCKTFPQDAANFKFRLEKKSFQFGYGTEMMFRETLPNLAHGSDGLIFTCVETAYKFGTDENILKWKPADENTIDFKLGLDFPPTNPETNGVSEDDDGVWEYDYNSMPEFTLHVHHQNRDDRPYATMFATDAEWYRMKSWSIEHDDGLDGQIVECHKDEEGRWRFNRFRDDKKEANHYTTVEKVLESIEDSVSREELIAAAGEIRVAWKKRAEEQKKRMEAEEQKKRMEDRQRRDTMSAR